MAPKVLSSSGPACPRTRYPERGLVATSICIVQPWEKLLVAYLPESELEEIFLEENLEARLVRYTPATFCSRRSLLADLEKVRARGFSLNTEEAAIGGMALAAPIFSHIKRVTASICVRGTASQFSPERISGYAKEVVSVATQISRELS